MHSRLLIDEPPLLVLRSLAKAFGLNEAIILQQMHYMQTSDRNKNHFDGRVWVRNTYEELGREFPFWGKNTIVRTIDKLYEQHLILSFMKQTGFRNQKYYTIDYEALNQIEGLKVTAAAKSRPNNAGTFSASEYSEIDLPKMGRSTYQNVEAKESPPSSFSGFGSSHNGQVTGFGSEISSADCEISRSPITQYGSIELPNMGRPSTQNGSSSEQVDSNQNFQKACEAYDSTPSQSIISGSPTTQDGSIDLPNLGRPSTQNGYVDLPKMGKTYKEAESFLRDINPPPLTPPNSKSAKASEEEEDLFQRMIKVWNRLVQGKIKDAPRKELVLTDSRKQALEALFRGILNHDFAEWERYCKQISETRFLLGENTSGFKVSLEWALKPDCALKVLEGRIYDKPQSDQGPRQLAPDDFEYELINHFRENELPQEWLKVYLILANEKGQPFYHSWLKNCRPLPVKHNRAVLQVETLFYRDYMTTHYLSEIKHAAQSVWPTLEELTIEVKQ